MIDQNQVLRQKSSIDCISRKVNAKLLNVKCECPYIKGMQLPQHNQQPKTT